MTTRLTASQPQPDAVARPRPDGPGSGGAARAALLSGAGFVVAVLAGNSLTETATGDGVLGELEAMATSTAARTGVMLELVGFVLMIVFVGAVLGRVRTSSTSGGVAAVAGAVMVAVKLGSGAALLAALDGYAELDEATATGLVEQNGASFVLFWLPFGTFVVAAAVALAAVGAIGPVLRWSGVALGALTVTVGVVGAQDPAHAVPIPFLLGLLWVLGTSVRLAVRPAAAA